MFIWIACILFLLSASGLIVSMLRLADNIFGSVSDAKLEILVEAFISLEWVSTAPSDALLLVAVFLIASALSLRGITRATTTSNSTRITRYRPYNWQV